MWQGYRAIRIILGISLVVFILGYALSKSVNLVEGPLLTLETPQDGETLDEPFLLISGNAQNIAFLSLNDRQIFVNDNGDILDRLLLHDGYNVITLRATDKFGRERVVTREVVYKP